jgi:ABC-type glycerol-3-phosphate transport system permease component
VSTLIEKTSTAGHVDYRHNPSRSRFLHNLVFIICLIFALMMLFPLFWMFSSSLKDKSEIFLNPPRWIPLTLHWENFSVLFTERHFGRILLNSLYTIGSLLLSSIAGFAFAKYVFKGKTILFMIVLGSMMIPQESVMVPMFIIYRNLGLVNNLWGIILPGLANAFGIFFMRQYCANIHSELLEAARVDGCSEIGLFNRIVLPSLRPAFASLGIIMFVGQWNNFLWPSIILRSEKFLTISLAIRALQDGPRTPFELIMSGSVLSVIPLLIIIFLFQKQLISGLLEGSVKG